MKRSLWRQIPLAIALALAAGLLSGCGDRGREFSLDAYVKSLMPTPPDQTLRQSVMAQEPDARRRAVYEMGKWKDPDDDLVNLVGLTLVGDPDAMTRAQAAETLGLWARPKSVRYLAVGLAGRVEPAEGASQDPADVALPKLADGDKFVRSRCAEALGKVQSDESIPALARALKVDPDRDVRRRCAESLGRYRNVTAAKALLIGLIDDDLGVCLASLDSLEYMTGEDLGEDAEAWGRFLVDSQDPLAKYGRAPRKVRTSAGPRLQLSEEKKAKLREIFSDLFPLERKEGPFD